VPYARVHNPYLAPPAISYANPGTGIDRETLPLFTNVGAFQIRYFRLPGEPGIGWEVYRHTGEIAKTTDGEDLWSPPGRGGSRDVRAAERDARDAIAGSIRSWEIKVNPYFAPPAISYANPAGSDFESYLVGRLVDQLEGALALVQGGRASEAVPAIHAARSALSRHVAEFGLDDRSIRQAVVDLVQASMLAARPGNEGLLGISLNRALERLREYAQGWGGSSPNPCGQQHNPYFAPPAISYANPGRQVNAYVVRDRAGNAVAKLQAYNLDEARQRAASEGYSGRKFRVNRAGRSANPGEKIFYVYELGSPEPIGSVAAKNKRSALARARKKFWLPDALYVAEAEAHVPGRSTNPGEKIFYVYELGSPEPIGSVAAKNKRSALARARKKFKTPDVTVVAEAEAHVPGQLFGAAEGMTAEDEIRLKREASGGQGFLF
jgi:hypothetical protein